MIKLIEREPSLKFIIPVLKWLKDPESVSKEERETNYKAATSIATPSVSTAAYVTPSVSAAAYAAHAAAVAARYADAACDAATTKEWVNKYFSKISITREEVESELFKGEEVEYNKEFFADKKIKIESVEHSRHVQGLAFKAGYSWSSDGKCFKHTKAKFIYFNGPFIIKGYRLNDFASEGRKEIFIPLPVEEAEPTNDAVQNPKHYELFEDTQVIEIIASSMSTEAFHGYCLGNVLKYRLRAGNKDNTIQELAKADKYKELYEDFKHLCK